MERLRAAICDASMAENSGIVEQGVDATEFRFCCGDRRIPIRRFRDVESPVDKAGSEVARQCPAFLILHVRNENLCALGGQQSRGRGADPSGSAGDDDA